MPYILMNLTTGKAFTAVSEKGYLGPFYQKGLSLNFSASMDK